MKDTCVNYINILIWQKKWINVFHKVCHWSMRLDSTLESVKHFFFSIPQEQSIPGGRVCFGDPTFTSSDTVSPHRQETKHDTHESFSPILHKKYFSLNRRESEVCYTVNTQWNQRFSPQGPKSTVEEKVTCSNFDWDVEDFFPRWCLTIRPKGCVK